MRDAAYNLTLSLLVCRPDLTVRRLIYGPAVGDRGTPGAIRAAVALLRRDRETCRRLAPSLRDQLDGLRAAHQGGALTLRAVNPAAVAGAAPEAP